MFASRTSKTTILRLLSWGGLHAGSTFEESKGKRKLLRKDLLSKITAEGLCAFLPEDFSRLDIYSNPQHEDSVQASPLQPLLGRKSVYPTSRGQYRYCHLPFPQRSKSLKKTALLSQGRCVNGWMSNLSLKQAYKSVSFIIKSIILKLMGATQNNFVCRKRS